MALKSITLGPGEKFVVPAGARLVGSTNPAVLESECDLPVMETLERYSLIWGLSINDDDNEQNFFDLQSHFRIYGIRLNGQELKFNPEFAHLGNGTFDGKAIIDAINKVSGGQLLFDAKYGWKIDPDRGAVSLINFKTTPSIARSFSLLGIASTASFENEPVVHAYFPRSFATLTTENFRFNTFNQGQFPLVSAMPLPDCTGS